MDSDEVPEACCRRDPQTRDGVLLSREECLLGRDLFLNKQVQALLSQAGARGWPELGGGSIVPGRLKALWDPMGLLAVMWD